MRLLSLTFAATMLLLACNNDKEQQKKALQAAKDTANYTTIKWLDTLKNFGTIKQGEKITISFACLNTGNKPLLITNVRPGCGCTVADYTKEAILPNKQGEVKASFDSKKFCDVVHKSIFVSTNTSNANEQVLMFTGKIINCESNDKVVVPTLPVTDNK